MEKYLTKEGIEYNSFIYIWNDTLLNKYYIGSHIGNIQDGYLFSGIDIKKEYNQRPQDFNREILSYHLIKEYKEIRDIEREYLIKYDVENKNEFYNRTNESYGGYHKKSVEKRLLDIDENGLNAFQRAAKKMVETRKSKNSYKTAKIKEFKTKNNGDFNTIKEKISNTLKGNLWINKDELTKYIKKDELNFYINDGWQQGKKNYSYYECQEFAKENNIKNAKEWYKTAKTNNVPHNPNRIFLEWSSWEDFLGKLKISRNNNYMECSNFAKKMNITSSKKWFEIAIENNMPFHPERKFKEWINWNHFLQKEN